MKVIWDAYKTPSTFKTHVKCFTCETRLEICTSDIRVKKAYAFSIFKWDGPMFYVNCPACNNDITLAHHLIPYFVKQHILSTR